MKLFLMAALVALSLSVSTGPVYLPNASLTPGVTNHSVTQENIASTICVHGFTGTIRPPASYTTKLKKSQLGPYGDTDLNLAHYEEDHLVSLELGGAPSDPKNLWPEPYASNCGAKTKDNLENRLHRLVCSGKLTLKQAQAEIATDWVKSYNAHIKPLVCQ